MPLDLFYGCAIDHRPDDNAFIRASTDLHLRDTAGEFCCKRIVDAGLYENPIGTDAGLAAIAELRRNRPLDRQVEVGIVEDNERRIAAKLEAEPLDTVGGTPHQKRAYAGRTGKGDLAYRFIRHQLLADLRRHAGYDIDHACRNAGPLRQNAERES